MRSSLELKCSKENQAGKFISEKQWIRDIEQSKFLVKFVGPKRSF